MRQAWCVAMVFLVITPTRAQADEDKDIDLIPKEVREERVSSATSTHSPASIQTRLYLEDALTIGSASQPLLVPFPPPSPYEWQNRSSADLSGHWSPLARLTLTLSDRFNVLEESDFAFPSKGTLRNDLREIYATWEPGPRIYLEAGRVNVRNGVALGFNPTDFFKTGTLVGQASLDPSVIRENRLGVLMARGQVIWNGGSSMIAFAPSVTSPPALSSEVEPGLDPRFAFTNSTFRLLCSMNFEIAGLSPQLLGYFEQDRSRAGVNASRAIGQSVIGYVEWAGGAEPNLIARAIAYGKETGTLPTGAPTVPPTSLGSTWLNDLAAGASWTSTSRITINLEYHFHQAGFSKTDWDNWFNLGAAGPPSLASELWYLRGYANAEQEPVSMHELFIRADWVDALVTQFELSGFAFVNLFDGSVFGQLAAIYSWTDVWTTGAFFSLSIGDARSEHGSVPQVATGTLQLVRYL